MGKKEGEQTCLALAMKLGLQRKGETRRIVKRLIGEEFAREKAESPDFVKAVGPTRKGDKGALVGIEHFCVDHLSEPMRKDGGKTVSSLGSKERSKIRALYDKGHKALMGTGELPEDAISELVSAASELFEAVKKSSYYSFLRSFDYSLNKHLGKTGDYRRELKALAKEGQRVGLAFLIEVHSDFSNMFLRDRRGVRRCPPGFMPMFEDVVSLLEKASGQVDHVVLVMSSTVHGKEASVLAINGNNIRGSLEKQRAAIYEYVGEDRFQPERREMPRRVEVTPTYTHDESGLNMTLECTWTDAAPECKFEAAMLGLKKAHGASLAGRCCVSTFTVHFLSEVLMDRIICWPEMQNGSFAAMPQIAMSAEEPYARFRSFEDRWMEER